MQHHNHRTVHTFARKLSLFLLPISHHKQTNRGKRILKTATIPEKENQNPITNRDPGKPLDSIERTTTLLVTCRDLAFVREKAHETARGVLVSVHEPTHESDQSSCHHRRSLDPWLDP